MEGILINIKTRALNYITFYRKVSPRRVGIFRFRDNNEKIPAKTFLLYEFVLVVGDYQLYINKIWPGRMLILVHLKISQKGEIDRLAVVLINKKFTLKAIHKC